jgi:hypothetical protein
METIGLVIVRPMMVDQLDYVHSVRFPPIALFQMKMKILLKRMSTMDRDELREKIIDLLYGKLDRPQQAKGLADSILSLLAPELEKARKYDEALPLIQEMEEKARMWDRVKEIALKWCKACGDSSACSECFIKVSGFKPISDAIAILHNRYIKDDPKRLASLKEERDALEGEGEKG